MSSTASSADLLPRPSQGSPHEEEDEESRSEIQGLVTQASRQNVPVDASMMMMSMLSGLANASAPIPSMGSSSPAGPPSSLKDRKHGLEGPPGYMPAASSGEQQEKQMPNLQHVSPPGMQTLPHPLAALLATQAQPQTQQLPQATASPSLLVNMMHSPSHLRQEPTFSTDTPSSTIKDSYAGSENVRPPPNGSGGTAADPDLEDASLSLLMETMDAWEEAVTKRMYSAVQDAIKAARSDVMQIVEAKFASRAAAHSTAAAPAPAPTPAERNAMSGTAPASSSGRAADAISPKQTNPNAMADMLRQMHQMGLSMDRRGSPSAALDAGTSGLSQLIEKPQSSPLAEARNLNVDGTTGGAGPPPARSEPQAGKDDKGDQMRAQMHAYGAMFLDPLSALTTSAGLGAPSVPPVQSPDTREETTKSEPWNGSSPSLAPPVNVQAGMARQICEAAVASTSQASPSDMSDISRLLQACMGPPAAVATGEKATEADVVSSCDLSAPMVEAAQQLFFVERADLQSPRRAAACGAEGAPNTCTSSPLGDTGIDTCTQELQESSEAAVPQEAPVPEADGAEELNSLEQPTIEAQTKDLAIAEESIAVHSNISSGAAVLGPETSMVEAAQEAAVPDSPGSQPFHNASATQSHDVPMGTADHPESSGSVHVHEDASQQPESGLASDTDSGPDKTSSAVCKQGSADVSAHSQTSQDCAGAAEEARSMEPAPEPAFTSTLQDEEGEAGFVTGDSSDEPVKHRQQHNPAGAVAECHINVEESLEFFGTNLGSFERTDSKNSGSLYLSPRPCHHMEDVDSQPLFLLASSSPSKGSMHQACAVISADINRRQDSSAVLPLQNDFSPQQEASSVLAPRCNNFEEATTQGSHDCAIASTENIPANAQSAHACEATGSHCAVENGSDAVSQHSPPQFTFGSLVVSVQGLQNFDDALSEDAPAQGDGAEIVSSPQYDPSPHTCQLTDTPTVSQFGRSQAHVMSPPKEDLSDNCTQRGPDKLTRNNPFYDIEQPHAAGSRESDHCSNMEQAPNPSSHSLSEDHSQPSAAAITSHSPDIINTSHGTSSTGEQQTEICPDKRYPLQSMDASVSSPVQVSRAAETPVDPTTPQFRVIPPTCHQDDGTHSFGHKENFVHSASKPSEHSATKCCSPEMIDCKKHRAEPDAPCQQPSNDPKKLKASPVSSSPCQHQCPTTLQTSPSTCSAERVSETPMLQQPVQGDQYLDGASCPVQSLSSSPCRIHTHSSTQTHNHSQATHVTRDKPTGKAKSKLQASHGKESPQGAAQTAHVMSGSTDDESSALIAACARALDSVSSGHDESERNIDVSKELHALEADVLRACVLGGAGSGEVPWRTIMHHKSLQGSDNTGASTQMDIAEDPAEESAVLDIDQELTCMVKDTLVAVNSSAGCSYNSQRSGHRKRHRSSAAALRDKHRVATTRTGSLRLLKDVSYPFHPLASSDFPSDGSCKSSGAHERHTKQHSKYVAAPQGTGLNSLQLVAAVCAAACAGSMHAANAHKTKFRSTGALPSDKQFQEKTHRKNQPGEDKSSTDPNPRRANNSSKETSWLGRPQKPQRGRFRVPEGIARATEKWLAARRPAQASSAVPVMGYGRTNSRTARSASPQLATTRTSSRPSRRFRSECRESRTRKPSPPVTKHSARNCHTVDPAQDPRRIMRARSWSGNSIPRGYSADAHISGPSSAHQYQGLPHNQGQLQGNVGSPRAMRRSMSGHFIPTSPSSADAQQRDHHHHHSAPAPLKRSIHNAHQHTWASPRSPARGTRTQTSCSQSPSRSKRTKQAPARGSSSRAHSATRPLRTASVSPRLPKSPTANSCRVHGAYNTSCTSRTPQSSPKRVSRGRVPSRRAVTPPQPLSDSYQPRPASSNPNNIRRCASTSPKTGSSVGGRCPLRIPSGMDYAQRKFVNPSPSLDWQLTPDARNWHTGRLTPRNSTQSGHLASTTNHYSRTGGRSGNSSARNHSDSRGVPGGVPHDLRAEFAENMRAARALMATAAGHSESCATPPMRAPTAVQGVVQNTSSTGLHNVSGIGMIGSQDSSTMAYAASNTYMQAPLTTGGTSAGALQAVAPRSAVGEQGHSVQKIPTRVHEAAAGVGIDQVSARQQLWASISAVRQDLGRLQ